mmetsp:Transcript_15845/g.32573  ORF Transcript_15845/g.32573 Transcript_15845/m.32573 type:complete len:386 (-) Transcript_15845:76-1233(-)|eukprot:CAMPEP_0118662882 /NCGR_PEP_ID=MMETSP0785-20121206/17081_1 /TAXON_ID=91992 /ORGANISM="Bolidomonas pacifica, Strain CCMP 1866" /LENGTH=385 /DNA_ID=CAMNT_0006556481 /DNA_START=182 /DNA_END=1339 /DNA_ORIENTATION=-
MFGFGGGGGMPSRFEEQYHTYSVACASKPHLEGGDKIILPPSALDSLSRMMIEYPMLFKLSSPSGQSTHCGVLEFSAPEGSCYIPFWIMQNLLIPEGGLLTVTNVSLPKASFVKLQPQHVDFLEISNPRAVLEHALRNYSCVTKGDVICIPYNDKNYYLELKDVKPQDAACIIETDCNVDFDPPVGYVEPDYKKMAEEKVKDTYKNMPKQTRFGSFTGSPSASPATSAPSSTKGVDLEDMKLGDPATAPSSTRIVNGVVIKGTGKDDKLDEKLVADKIGGTGVQRNAAIPQKAPEVLYWAEAGGGARLDGKQASPLKDKEGNVVDARELRAAAAAARAMSTGEGAQGAATKAGGGKRRSLIGNKFSKRKASSGPTAFGGGGNSMM